VLTSGPDGKEFNFFQFEKNCTQSIYSVRLNCSECIDLRMYTTLYHHVSVTLHCSIVQCAKTVYSGEGSRWVQISSVGRSGSVLAPALC
jgi:hypothetical protein